MSCRIQSSEVPQDVWSALENLFGRPVKSGGFNARTGKSGYLACDAYAGTRHLFVKGTYRPSTNDNRRFSKEADLVRALASESQLQLLADIIVSDWRILVFNWIEGRIPTRDEYPIAAAAAMNWFNERLTGKSMPVAELPFFQFSEDDNESIRKVFSRATLLGSTLFSECREVILDSPYVPCHWGYFPENLIMSPDGVILVDYGSTKLAPRVLEAFLPLTVVANEGRPIRASSTLFQVCRDFPIGIAAFGIAYWWRYMTKPSSFPYGQFLHLLDEIYEQK